MAGKSAHSSTKTVTGRPFKPGQSGNPNGRPRIPEPVKANLKAIVDEGAVKLLDLVRDDSMKPEFILRAVELARDSLYGKPSQSVDMEINRNPVVGVEDLAPEEEIALLEKAVKAAKKLKENGKNK